MGAFDYPDTPLQRRHGPQGYTDYSSYRPWLRDEFTFRCVYCLNREQWGRIIGEFDLDHFQPQAHNPDEVLEYNNLLYTCHTCNLRKNDKDVPDPGTSLTAAQVRVNYDGSIEGLSDDAARIIDVLVLNSDRYKDWRLIWMRNIELTAEYDKKQYLRMMGFPEDLPNLSNLRPPGGNMRPEGIAKSWFQREQDGDIPEEY